MVALATQIVHFLPQIGAFRSHLGEALAQAQNLRLQRRAFKGQFFARFSRRLHGAEPS
jgi:hypothetical protein